MRSVFAIVLAAASSGCQIGVTNSFWRATSEIALRGEVETRSTPDGVSTRVFVRGADQKDLLNAVEFTGNDRVFAIVDGAQVELTLIDAADEKELRGAPVEGEAPPIAVGAVYTSPIGADAETIEVGWARDSNVVGSATAPIMAPFSDVSPPAGALLSRAAGEFEISWNHAYRNGVGVEMVGPCVESQGGSALDFFRPEGSPPTSFGLAPVAAADGQPADAECDVDVTLRKTLDSDVEDLVNEAADVSANADTEHRFSFRSVP